jgi:hypothetical protein
MSLRRKLPRLCVGIAIALLLFHASLGFRMVKLPHPDEVWTMNLIAEPVSKIFKTVLAGDNHPPLFYVLASMWRGIVGSDLNSIRILPFLFSCLTILAFAWFLRQRSLVALLVAIGLVGTNPLFVYYSATLRPYSLLVLTSSLVTLSVLRLRDLWSNKLDANEKGSSRIRVFYYLSLFLLSLSHYFGFAFAVILTVFNLYERKAEPKRWRSLAFFAAICIWPLIHFSLGSLAGQAVHNDWVNVLPFVSTTNNFLMGVFPLLTISKQPQITFGLILVFFFLLSQLNTKHFSVTTLLHNLKSRADAISNETYLVLAMSVLILSATIIDFLKPLSTPYYFLVCLPPVAILCSRLFDDLLWKSARADRFSYLGIFASILLLQVVLSYQRLASV